MPQQKNSNKPLALIAEEGFSERSSEDYFFTASTLKLVVMSICTAGGYELYWFIKNWMLMKDRSETKSVPWWYPLLPPMEVLFIFSNMKAAALQANIRQNLSPIVLTLGFCITFLALRLPGPYLFLGYFTFAFVLPFNSLAIKINKGLNANFKNNERFSFWNWLAVIFGGMFFLLLDLIEVFAPKMLNP